MSLKDKTVVLGITGGIAAYKSAAIVSRLRKLGVSVHVIMTENATQFIAPLTFESLSGHPTVTDTFRRPDTWEVEHIALAKKADVFAIAPCTANMMAKLAWGLADDMLSTTALATRAPLLLAPAMNTGMWTADATRRNLATLRERGVRFVGPDAGFLACGDEGAGRMSEPEEIVKEIVALLQPHQDLAGLKVLVTAGATREYLDPVRFMTNESSGRMGMALVEAALERGAQVQAVCGHMDVQAPAGAEVIPVVSTRDLYERMLELAPRADIVIQAAAPADYRFAETADHKLKKQGNTPLTFTLVENPDVAAAVGAAKREGQTLVGFAAETENAVENARKKLASKHLDMIVANDVTLPGAGFNGTTNIATLITAEDEEARPMESKRSLADAILNRVLRLRGAQVSE